MPVDALEIVTTLRTIKYSDRRAYKAISTPVRTIRCKVDAFLQYGAAYSPNHVVNMNAVQGLKAEGSVPCGTKCLIAAQLLGVDRFAQFWLFFLIHNEDLGGMCDRIVKILEADEVSSCTRQGLRVLLDLLFEYVVEREDATLTWVDE
jgi:hypothetical protein